MFKFVRLSDIETVDKIVGDNPTIKFSSVFNLNDPYELKFNLKIDPYSDYTKTEYFKTYPEKNLEDFKSWQGQVTDQFIWHTEQEQRNTIARLITIASFAGNKENNLMWSHYTDNHKGICVEYYKSLFDFLKKQKGFFVSAKVKYSETPPTVDSSESIQKKIMKMIFNKQIEWQYEEELRVVFQSDNDTDFIPIENKLIKAVYIGSKTPSHIEKYIVATCKRNNIKILYGITLGDSYKVKFSEQKDGTTYMRTFWN